MAEQDIQSMEITQVNYLRDNDPASCEAPNNQLKSEGFWDNMKYLVLGTCFGIVFVKAEIVSWFRIQEMFQLTSFHMYGVIGTAVITAMISVFLIKKFRVKSLAGEAIVFRDKKFNRGQIYGGLIFGLGWAITGACPGPLFAQIGSGFYAIGLTLVSAVAGTWLYGYFRDRLPA